MTRLRAVAASLIALAIGILLVEAALQVGAAVVRFRGTAPALFHTGSARILCLGDSNTYGVYLERGKAYPAQLEALWNARPGAARIEVLNLGAPGVDSSRIRNEIPRMLAATAPQVVLLMVGVNDFWTVPTPLAKHDEEGRLASVLQHSRLRRLLFSMRRAWQSVECDVVAEEKVAGAERGETRVRCADEEFALSYQRNEGSRGQGFARLEENLRAIVAEVRSAGATAFLMTYPSSSSIYLRANRISRRVAHETGTPLVDLAEEFRAVCPQEPCREWLFADHHPTAQGYRRVSEILVDALTERSALAKRGRSASRE